MLKGKKPDSYECVSSIRAIRDALYVLNGKWKLPIIAGLADGPLRFKELQRALGDITPRVLSNELRELELNDFVIRKVFDTAPVSVTYELTEYSQTLGPVMEALKAWGTEHRRHIIKK